MPLPPTVSCSSKIQIGFTFLVPAHLGSPGQRAVKRMYVCMYVDGATTANNRFSGVAKNGSQSLYLRLLLVASLLILGYNATASSN